MRRPPVADGTHIAWTEATLFGAPLPRRCRGCRQVKPIDDFSVDRSRPDGRKYLCRACIRTTPIDEPNRIDRSEAALRGQAWCSRCNVWLAKAEVTKQGLCRPHQREIDRERYATDPEHRHRRRQHAQSRKRGVAPLPLIAVEYLTEEFEGRCAYCPAPATTWDHVVPVVRGGDTTPLNIAPACSTCNSSKRDRNVWAWLAATGREPSIQFLDRILREGDIDG